ncbi:MAG: DNA-binding response regulator [Gammaproteobacteria bacterium]|nr:MAG: DNA-binding response regulator [Gammaproteobacteria bacterium]
MRILIVEDDPNIRSMLCERLRSEGFVIDQAEDGREGLYMAAEYPIDLAVVDIGLPEISGIELIKKIREENLSYPILILTARGAWQDKVEGLNSGADDYLVKPFAAEELIARVNALLRRSKGFADSVIKCGPIKVDTKSCEVAVNETSVDLTSYEYKVLEYLMYHPNEVVSKTTLTEHIYEQDFDRDSNTIEVFMRRLRKKLDPEKTIQPIDTLRGRGYRINPQYTKP